VHVSYVCGAEIRQKEERVDGLSHFFHEWTRAFFIRNRWLTIFENEMTSRKEIS
jgi:hypothetical protein